MKVAAIALFLGCTAIVCSFAVQSNLFHLEPNTGVQPPQTQSFLNRLGFSYPAPAPAPATAPLQVKEDGIKAPAIPLLSKAETLALIAESAAKYRVSAAFVTSIVAAESNFDCAAVSPKGAIGLMQLMPETAQQFGANPAVPAENIDAGTRYLRWLAERYQKSRSSIKRVIAAYNAGPGMVDRYRGVPPFRETQNYVARVMGFFKQYSPARKPARGRTRGLRNTAPEEILAEAE